MVLKNCEAAVYMESYFYEALKRAAELRKLALSVSDLLYLSRACNSVFTEQSRALQAASLLTERQLEIVRAIAYGESVKATARRLQLSSNTIRTHRRNAYKRLGVHSAGQAVSVVMAAVRT
ncbi:response regulator transcription factor [Streptomyces gamaensis]|uniref:Response regulator transcription factor n=1 Tax=Streptomyces gamaensis TaxID=1763542 RepID=A0ABW0Z5U0_9ACTN